MDHGSYDQHQDYCSASSMAEPELLHRLRRTTHLRCIHPRMASGPFLGRVLSMISTMVQPQRILEIGTFTGYSALCLAEGLPASGELMTIEKNDELGAIQEEFIAQSAFAEQIQRCTGDALELLPELQGTFDLIFLDADKENYHLYFPELVRLSQSGTVILIDNMLWEGKVIFEEFQDEQTDSIRKLTQMIKDDERLEQVLLPIRDGLMVIRVR